MKAALVVSAIFCFYFAIIYLISRRKWSRMAATLLARRPNPTQGEFVSFLAPDVEPETAEWFWNELLIYFRPTLAPHPDDDLMSDLWRHRCASVHGFPQALQQTHRRSLFQ